ncbi:MAG: hypothetical protein GX621_13845, partial [Pirellulaceae bacterium]|nr:hypothetical protein [Pirellulaceae bacterium]
NGKTETIAGLQTVAPGRGVVQNVQNDSGVSANGTLIVNSSSDVFFDGYIRDRGADNSTGGVALVKQGAGTLTLAGANITYTAGTTVSAGTLVLQDTTNSTFLTKNILVNGTLEFATVNASPTFNGQLSGNGTVVKSGTRNLAFGGDNTGFTGTITINAGRFRDVSGPDNFGHPSMIYVNDGGQIYTYNDDEYDFSLSIAGNGHSESAGYLGALRLYNGSTWAGDITLTDDARITAYDAMATITGNISDGDNCCQLTFCSGNGGYPASGIYLEPSSGNSWTGGTLIAGAIVQLNADNALPDGGAVTLGHPTLGAGGLDLNGRGLTVSSLATGTTSPSHSTFWDEVSNTSATPATLKVVYDNDNDACVYAGVLSGNLDLEKDGSGWLKLAGRNYNIGDADVYNGTLDIRFSSYRGAVEAHDTGVAFLPEIAWYTITLSDKSGGSYADTLTGPSHPVGVLGDWQDAVIDSVEGAVGIQHLWFTAIYTFGEFSGGLVGPTGQAYRVGTVAELNAAVKAMHNNQDVFTLDYSLPADKKLIVLESRLGYADCDYDYDDVYWEVTATPIEMSLEDNSESINEGELYALTLGEVTGLLPTMGVTKYTIDWGDGTPPEEIASSALPWNRQVGHYYADGPAFATISVAVEVDNSGTDMTLATMDVSIQN